jgi:signal peptide peptidase-like protein 3
MEALWRLVYLLEPASVVLIATAVFVVSASAQRALTFEKESERHRDFAEASITLDSSQALMIPIASSCSLLLMFYLFASMSQFIMGFTAVASASSLAFCMAPYVTYMNSQMGLLDPIIVNRGCCGSFSRTQGLLVVVSCVVVAAWLVTGHWLLNNVLGISICIAFVSHVRLPNIKICALLLLCLFVYDIFWVFFSEQFFGSNVMVSVATQQASNPIHTVASSLNLQGLSQAITKKLELPVKLVFPRNLLGGWIPSGSGGTEFLMLGLGDMAIPGMLLTLVLCFDHRKGREHENEGSFSRGNQYIRYAVCGYSIGLITALAAGLLSQLPQPALLYLVPSTLGPVACAAWAQGELGELWNGLRPVVTDKARLMEV